MWLLQLHRGTVCLLRLAAVMFQSLPHPACRWRVECFAKVLNFAVARDTQETSKGRLESTAAMPLQLPCLILMIFHLPSLHVYLLCVKFTGCSETPSGQSLRNILRILSDGICISAGFSFACIQVARAVVKLGNATLVIRSHKANRPKSG